jgi:mannose-6-phosphate isomerase-like protein (cupin superfamily)
MKKFILFIIIIFGFQGISQDVFKLKKEKPDEIYENIHVRKISDSPEQTTFLIWIKNGVKLHKHVHHAENIYVISGKGEMTIGDEKLVIKKGDFFTIPKNTPHGLEVRSSTPVKVLSIQSPQFKGVDRIFINAE